MAGSCIDQDYGFAVPLHWEACVSNPLPDRPYGDQRLTLFVTYS